LASSLNHPNICTILDVDEGNGQAFIAMELLHGQSLKVRLSGDPLSLTEIIDIATQVADALAAAHDEGIVHGDIAPGNVFITNDGLVKLLDFGLAKHAPNLGGNGQTTDELTAVGVVAGTVHYMSPERFTDAAVDYRSDLFSLGVLLYHMATGARPFDVEPRNALISAIESEPHVPVRERAPHLPAELARIIDKLLAKRPKDRYQSTRALRVDLDAMDVGSTLRRHTPIARGRRPPVMVAFLTWVSKLRQRVAGSE
jgi:serine/threonine protein kinase